jgi:hypothetical protein
MLSIERSPRENAPQIAVLADALTILASDFRQW